MKKNGLVVKRFEVFWVSLDPTVGSEIRKTRPCVIISPDELNKNLRTVLVAPLTSTIKNFPTWIRTRFEKKEGCIVLDQNTGKLINPARKRLELLVSHPATSAVNFTGNV